MTPDEALLDALQWLKDCGGSMALRNNPMAHQLIKAGLAEKGGYNKRGQQLLILSPDATAALAPTNLVEFFRDLPPDATAETVKQMSEAAIKLFPSLPDSRTTLGTDLTSSWGSLVTSTSYLVGWTGSDYRENKGGVILMSASAWVYLGMHFKEAEFHTKDAYIQGNILGTLKGTSGFNHAVLVHTPLAPRELIILNHDFKSKTTCSATTDPTP